MPRRIQTQPIEIDVPIVPPVPTENISMNIPDDANSINGITQQESAIGIDRNRFYTQQASDVIFDNAAMLGVRNGEQSSTPPEIRMYSTNFFGSERSNPYTVAGTGSMFTPPTISAETQERMREALETDRIRRAELEREQRQIDEAQATWRNALNAIPSSRNREFTNPITTAANEMAAGRITVDEATRLNIAGQFQNALGREINSHQAVTTNIPVKEKPVIEEFNYYKHFGALVAE